MVSVYFQIYSNNGKAFHELFTRSLNFEILYPSPGDTFTYLNNYHILLRFSG
jgi:hypothetical protein